MRSLRFLQSCALGAVFAIGWGAAVPASAQSPVEGVWRSETGTEITITTCDEGFCGYLSKIVVPPEFKARYGAQLEALSVEEYFDFNNPDPELRNRRMLGLRIITMRQGGSASHYSGELYNAADGKTYAGSLDVLDAGRIRVTGCVLMVFCKGEDWVRVPADP